MSTRKVPYELRQTDIPDQSAVGLPACYDGFATFTDGQGFYIPSLSENDYTALRSCVVTGSEIAYSDQAHYLQQLFDAGISCVPSGQNSNMNISTVNTSLSSSFATNATTPQVVTGVSALQLDTDINTPVQIIASMSYSGNGVIVVGFLRSDNSAITPVQITDLSNTRNITVSLDDQSPLGGNQTYRLAIHSVTGSFVRVYQDQPISLQAMTIT